MTFTNHAFMGWAVMDAVLAESPFLCDICQSGIFHPMPILMVSGSCGVPERKPERNHSMKEYILTPVNAAIVVGLIMFIFQLRFPAPVDNAVQGMSSLTNTDGHALCRNDSDKSSIKDVSVTGELMPVLL